MSIPSCPIGGGSVWVCEDLEAFGEAFLIYYGWVEDDLAIILSCPHVPQLT
jgi:hypothetical protein